MNKLGMRAEAQNLPRGWPHHIEKMLDILEEHRPMLCVELGTYAGASAIAMARMLQRWGGRLTCVDTWTASPITECVENMQRAGVMAGISLVPSSTTEVAKAWHTQIDFLYIDAGHSYEEVRDDLNNWWPHLKIGGIICGDDYDLPGWDGVKQAWDLFEAKHGQAFEHFATENTEPPGMKLVWGVKR